jgi:hypothetical protein
MIQNPIEREAWLSVRRLNLWTAVMDPSELGDPQNKRN